MGRHYFYKQNSINFLAPFRFDKPVGLHEKTADEQRFNVPGLHQHGASSLPAGLRQWGRVEGRGLGFAEGGAGEEI